MAVTAKDIPEVLDAQRAMLAQQQLDTWLASKAEGMSILNYNLANKQYLDALNIGKLLGVDTTRLRPYGGETANTVNVIGTDAMDVFARRSAGTTAEASQEAPQHGWLKKAALGTAMVLGGATLPFTAKAIMDELNPPVQEQVEPGAPQTVEVEVY